MIDLICKTCDKKFIVKNYRAKTALYCSKKCHAIATVAGKNKNSTERNCKRCKKIYLVTKAQINISKFCSRLCQNRQQAQESKESKRFLGEKNPRYKNGIMIYRRIAKENFPWICNRCKSVKNITVHHKDENRYNNSVENLEVICRSCHQKEHKVYLNLGAYAQPLQASEI